MKADFQQYRIAVALLACLALTSCKSVATFETIDDAFLPGIFLDLDGRATLPAGMNLRPVTANGLAVTKAGEGWRSRLYNDAVRFCTIGYGHLVKRAPCDGSERADWRDGITEPEGAALLVDDMSGAQVAVMLSVTTRLSDSQYAALCDFVFNVGATNFRKSRLLQVVNAGQHDQVANQLLRWTLADHREVPGLRNRRQLEIDLYYEGQLAPRAVPPAGEVLTPLDIRTGT